MHVDLFYELSAPKFAERDERQVYHDTLEEWALADTLGFRTAWLVEHHFLREYSHSSAPDLFLAAAAQRTQRLRLGHAIVPLPFHHPVQVAERLATLDVLSSGRIEFGFGRGFSPTEYASFGVPMAESRARVDESLAILRAFFQGAPVNFQGQFYQLDNLDIVPKVVQDPHPPLWMAAVSPESFQLAARLGVGVLVGPFKPWFMVKSDLQRYRQAWQEHHGTAPARVAMTIGVLCLPDGQRARQLANTALTWFYRELLKTTAPVLRQLHAGYEYYRKLGSIEFLLNQTLNLRLLEAAGMVVVGDAEHCRARFDEYRAAGVDHLLCAVGAGAVSTAVVRESLSCLAEDVLPRLAP